MTAQAQCAFGGCGQPVMAKSHCNTHYHQARRRGFTSPIGERHRDGGRSFESQLDYWTWIVEDGCHVCVRPPVDNGYCRLWAGGAYKYAHRVSYEREHGPVPAGLVVNHKCGVRQCTNPGHLEAVTPAENSQYQTVRRPSISGHRGVTPHHSNGSWYAEVTAFGRRYRKGGFATAEEANEWAAAKRAEVHPLGDFSPAP